MALERTPRITVQPNNSAPYSGEWVDYDWQERAACRNGGEDMITPDDPSTLVNQWCRGCEVRIECGKEALRLEKITGHGAVGIWGGVYISKHHRSRRTALATLRMLCYPREGAA